METISLVVAIINFVLSFVAAAMEFVVFLTVKNYWRWIKLALSFVLFNMTIIYAFILFDGGVNSFVLRIEITFLLMVLGSAATLRYIEIKTRAKNGK